MVSLCSSAVLLGNLHILHADSRREKRDRGREETQMDIEAGEERGRETRLHAIT